MLKSRQPVSRVGLGPTTKYLALYRASKNTHISILSTEAQVELKSYDGKMRFRFESILLLRSPPSRQTRYILGEDVYPYPIALTTMHMVACSVFCTLCYGLRGESRGRTGGWRVRPSKVRVNCAPRHHMTMKLERVHEVVEAE